MRSIFATACVPLLLCLGLTLLHGIHESLCVHGFANTAGVIGSVAGRNMITKPDGDAKGQSQSADLLVPLGASLNDCEDSNIVVADETEYDYDSNPTVFGKLLRGELETTRIIRELNRLLVFEDIKPRAPLHALVIPKQHIPSLFDLDTSRGNCASSVTSSLAAQTLLEEMNTAGKDLVRERYPQAFDRGDYILCFHLPPFNSVDHLHLHVLAPASSMHWMYRDAKYNVGKRGNSDKKVTGFSVRWCIGMEEVLARIRAGSPPTPYRKDDDWLTAFSDAMSSLGSIIKSSFFD
mmetsp:Transcript_33380/g.78749  ORF Transcript_33380/g.78749 Transcript_33380/m.78749 type:complete len:293 (+) Transcript_33380:226-1104(+)